MFKSERSANPWNKIIDCAVIAIIFGLYAASPPPDVNEAHYLTKARQFWQPDWLPRDLFLTSSFAHWLFYATFGWFTSVLDFDAAAWVGRILGWILLAIGWESLTAAQTLSRSAKWFSAVGLLILIEWGNMSGEWLVGGIEAKVPAYAFVLLALASATRNLWTRVWIFAGLACAFHLLVGGWALAALILCRFIYWRRSALSSYETLAFVVATAMIFFAMMPMLAADRAVDEWDFHLASRIQVRQRLSHHLFFGDFSNTQVLCFCLMCFVWVELFRRSKQASERTMFWFGAASLAFVACGLVLSSISTWDPPHEKFRATVVWEDVMRESVKVADWLLRLYWFRLADVAIPMGIAVAGSQLMLGCSRDDNRAGASPLRVSVALRWGVCIVSVLFFLLHPLDTWRDGRPRADRQSLPEERWNRIWTQETHKNWVRVCRWVADNTPQDALFVTPRKQQTFKWYAGRAEFVNWKDAPQDAPALLQWERRMSEVWNSWDDSQPEFWNLLGQFSLWANGIQYIVLEQEYWDDITRRSNGSEIQHLLRVYPEESHRQTTYVVVEVKRETD